MTRRRRWLAAAAVVAAAALAAVWRAGRPVPVTVEPVARGRAVEAIYATGTVEAAARATVRARLAEHVVELRAREGQAVRRGELLARLEVPVRGLALAQGEALLRRARRQAGPGSPQLAALEAQARAVRAQLGVARLELARTARLAAVAAVPGEALDLARAAVAQLAAQAEAADQAARAARVDVDATRDQLAAQVASLAVEADEGAVVAPLDGVVLRRAVEPGELVAAGQALFEVADLATRRVELCVDEADVARVRAGAAPTPAALTFDGFPGRAFAGRVVEILPSPDRARRCYVVAVALDAPPEGLRVGMTAEANLVVARADDALLLPATALDGDHAWFAEGGRAVRRPVRLGLRDLARAEVLAGAAEGAAAIVDAAAHHLRDGDRVAPRRAPPRPPAPPPPEARR